MSSTMNSLRYRHTNFFTSIPNPNKSCILIKPKTHSLNFKTLSSPKQKSSVITTKKFNIQEPKQLSVERFTNPTTTEPSSLSSNGISRVVMFGGLSIGMVLFLMGVDDHKALALGPEGPLMEEFWDNMRRYALYALTVSTGAISVLVEPIVELMKNPISAVLIVVILGGGFFIVSQVVSAMIGLSDFSYEYTY